MQIIRTSAFNNEEMKAMGLSLEQKVLNMVIDQVENQMFSIPSSPNTEAALELAKARVREALESLRTTANG
jgi:hypothetical protein